MGSRKLVRIFLLSKQLLHLQLQPQQVAKQRLPLIAANRLLVNRRYSVLDEFSKKIKGEAESNPEFQKTIKELKEKAGELKGVKEELKQRSKQTTERLYKRADGVWAEAEATAKKVSANLKDKISSAAEDVKETLGVEKQESTGTTNDNVKSDTGSDTGPKDGQDTASGEGSKKPDTNSGYASLFELIKSRVSSAGFEKLKGVKVLDYTKKGYDIVKEELSSNPTKRRRMQYEASSSSNGERSTSSDIVAVRMKQTRWGKKWDAFKEKIHSHPVYKRIRGISHPVYKRIRGISEPVVTKSQELAEDMRERWETSDHPVVHKIQDLNDTVFGETGAALSFKEIRRRDPTFSLPEFVAEVEEMTRPTLNALLKGDAETLKKNCSPEVIERCLAERRAYESQGIFFDNKILHISELEVRETKLMGSTPIIILAFQTQQIHCVRDRNGKITEGGEDTIHTVYYLWAMQQVDAEELGEETLYPTWRLREMQQLGVQALI